VWDRKYKRRLRRAYLSQWLHRKRVRQYARFGFTPAPGETFKEFDKRVEHSLWRTMLIHQA
jgi:hypothetical protein